MILLSITNTYIKKQKNQKKENKIKQNIEKKFHKKYTSNFFLNHRAASICMHRQCYFLHTLHYLHIWDKNLMYTHQFQVKKKIENQNC